MFHSCFAWMGLVSFLPVLHQSFGLPRVSMRLDICVGCTSMLKPVSILISLFPSRRLWAWPFLQIYSQFISSTKFLILFSVFGIIFMILFHINTLLYFHVEWSILGQIWSILLRIEHQLGYTHPCSELL